MNQHTKDGFVTELALNDEKRLVEATRRMVRSLPKLPHPRDLYSQVFAGTRHPWRTLLWLHKVAIRAGAPKEDALALLDEMRAWVESQYPAEDLPCLPEIICIETAAEGPENVAETAAAISPTPTNLERLEDRLRVSLRESRRLLERVQRDRRERATSSHTTWHRPMGAPGTSPRSVA